MFMLYAQSLMLKNYINYKRVKNMANKMYVVKTQGGMIRYATGRTKMEAFTNYMNAHINSIVLSIELLNF